MKANLRNNVDRVILEFNKKVQMRRKLDKLNEQIDLSASNQKLLLRPNFDLRLYEKGKADMKEYDSFNDPNLKRFYLKKQASKSHLKLY